jgi:CheY-like chemotaxis protein
MLAEGLLKPFRIRIDTADNGAAALRMISAQQYDLVLMDHLMPVMDGIEAVKELRRIENGCLQKTTVVALSANDGTGAGEIFSQAGMDGFITKPLDNRKIEDLLRTWLPDVHMPGSVRVSGPEFDGLPELAGIDCADGVRNSGSKELFLRLLGDFYKLIDIKADKIGQALAGGRIQEMTTEVHALKSAARMIGAGELSRGFAALERLCDEGNLEALERETPFALELFTGFKPMLKPFGEARGDKKQASNDEIIALLLTLKSSMDGFDLDGADEALKRLDGMRIPAACEAGMERLRAFVADVAMEETMELAETLISIINNEG